jgi:hypothetical protein
LVTIEIVLQQYFFFVFCCLLFVLFDLNRHRDTAESWITRRVAQVHPDAYRRSDQVRALANNRNTILSVVRSEEPWALQAMIDQRSIENVVLMGANGQNQRDQDECKHVARQDSRVSVMMQVCGCVVIFCSNILGITNGAVAVSKLICAALTSARIIFVGHLH